MHADENDAGPIRRFSDRNLDREAAEETAYLPLETSPRGNGSSIPQRLLQTMATGILPLWETGMFPAVGLRGDLAVLRRAFGAKLRRELRN